MPRSATTYRIFVVSPGDVQREPPLFDGDDGRYAFLQFHVAELKGAESK